MKFYKFAAIVLLILFLTGAVSPKILIFLKKEMTRFGRTITTGTGWTRQTGKPGITMLKLLKKQLMPDLMN